MQLTPTPTNIAVNMASTAPDPGLDPFVVVAAETLGPGPEPTIQGEIVLAPDSDDEFECNTNDWVVSPPHPSEFVRPPPVRPIFYVVTIGEEAGIYDSTWAETFDIRRVSRLEQFAMRTFRDWDEAHAHYTHEFNLNHVANTSRNSQRPPSPEPSRLAPPVTNPTAGTARAQSAPPLMVSARTLSGDRIQTAARPPIQLHYGTLSQCGTPSRPFYVPSSWPTPALVRHVSAQAVVAQPIIAQPVIAQPVIAQPAIAQPVVAQPVVAQPVIAQPAVVAQPARLGRGLLPTILEQTDRLSGPTGRRPMTQLHFDCLGRLVNPGTISVPSSPEEIELPPVRQPTRKPQPFPFIPDPDFFMYPDPQPQQDPTDMPVRPLSFPPSTPSESGEAIPNTPFLNTSQPRRRFVNLLPQVSASPQGITMVHDDPRADTDSEDVEVVATTLFVNGVTPQSSASTATQRGPPVASSSNVARGMRKRESPSTPTAKTTKPTKVRKTTSAKKSRAPASTPVEDDSKYASLWADD